MKRNFKESDAPINALPDYKIRTMKDDLIGKGLKEKEVAPPDKLPVAPDVLPLPPQPPTPPKPTFIPPAPKKPAEKTKPIQAGPPQSESLGGKPKIKHKTNFKFLLIIILVAIVFLGGVYWIGYKAEPEPEPEPEPEEAVLSEPLFPVNQLVALSLIPDTPLADLIKQEAQKEQLVQTFKRIAILKNETQYLSLAELIKELAINIPPYTLAELGPNYTLAVYSQNGMKRLVLTIEAKNAANLKEQLGFWEQTMVNDLKNLLLINSLPSPATSGFQNNIYKDTAIRYINFPEPDLTIDYAIKDNLFILTTSKESMYSIIDLLAPSDSRGVDKL